MIMSKMIWIIEDNTDQHPVYMAAFEGGTHNISFFKSFDAFTKALKSTIKNPDLIIADINLEDGHFFNLLNESDITFNTPYLVVSKSDEILDFENAYEAGAIDYILKPINQNELKSKVNRHLRLIEKKIIETSQTLKSLRINFNNYTNKEIRILESFSLSEGNILHRNQIVQLIWKNITIHPNTLDVHIYNLRRKLKQDDYTIKSIGSGQFKFIDLINQ